MTDDLTRRRRNLIASIAAIGAALVFAGYATFEQWAGLLSSLLMGAS